MAFNTATAARAHLIQSGYRFIPGKWWQNDAVAASESCVCFAKFRDGLYRVYLI